MKIIFVNRYFAPDMSATSQLLADLALFLADSGRVVHVITSRLLYDDPDANLPPREVINGVAVHRVWTSRFGRNWIPGRLVDYLTFYLTAALALWRLTRTGDIIVAKTDPPLIAVPASLIAKVKRAKMVNWLQDIFPEIVTALSTSAALRVSMGPVRSIRNMSLRTASANVVLGDRMAAYLRTQGVAADRIRVIANWADGISLQPVASTANSLRDSWHLGEKFIVEYSGNMGRAHEFETILSAAEQLRDVREIMFLLIGGGYWKAWIQEQVQARGMTNVQIMPYQPRDKLGLSLSAGDVHLISLVPALEGFVVPSKLYGIAAVGRPIIFIGDLRGEVADFITSAQCGITVSVGDVDRLVGQIRILHGSERMRAQWSQNARAVLMRDFDKSIALSAWSDLLSEIATAETATVPTK